MYDVIIVGAGPAGGTAAFYLGEGGAKVLMLEKCKIPRYKPCGGGLSIPFLKTQFPFSFDPVIEVAASQFVYRYCGIITKISCADGILGMVMRDSFDAYLLSHAKCDTRDNAPVRSISEESGDVKVTTEAGETYTGRYLIGADGANSIISPRVGLNHHRTLVAAIECEVMVSDPIMDQYRSGPTFIFNSINYGYSWIFPKKNGLSVGIAGLHPEKGGLKQQLFRVMNSMGIPIGCGVIHGHVLPFYKPGNPISTKRTLLVGDAAGLVDPFSGEGIRPAIKSGRLAAESILSGHPDRYSDLIIKHIARPQKMSLFISRIFYTLEELCLLLGAPNPFTTYAILEMLSDRGNSLGVMAQSVITLPYFLLFNTLSHFVRLTFGNRGQQRFRDVFFPKISPFV
jgi:geranylgeranyl reductase family protein